MSKLKFPTINEQFRVRYCYLNYSSPFVLIRYEPGLGKYYNHTYLKEKTINFGVVGGKSYTEVGCDRLMRTKIKPAS